MFNKRTVFFIVARIHYKINTFKGYLAVLLQLFHTFCKKHRILTARNADGYPVARRNQLIFLHRTDKIIPDRLAEFFYNTALNFNMLFKYPFQTLPSFRIIYIVGYDANIVP